jgi:hypothetical protein
MRPVKPMLLTIRAATLCALALGVSGVFVGVGCAAKARTGDSAAGTAGSMGTAGAQPTAGAAGGGAGTGGVVAGSAGAGVAGGAGTGPDPTGGAGAGTVPTGTGGTVDQGRLFTDAATVVIPDAGTTASEVSTGVDSGKTAPGDGNVGTCHIGGMSFVLVFTQKGTDVTMVATASNCAAGTHALQIHAGFSCDNAGTELGVWDGKRGDGIPAITCANNKGTLTYTRLGADPATNWTVGDHNTKTDITLHPMSADTSCGTFF